MLGGVMTSLLSGNQGHATIALFLVVASAAPLLIEQLWRVRLPIFIHVSYVTFLFLSMFCGEVLGMYSRFYPWDDIMHFLSGILVGLSAVLWLTSVVDRAKLRLSAWLHALLVLCIGASTAVVWEIVEFSSDHLFGTFTQRNDLFDTMTDLIYGTTSALLVAALLYLALRNRPSLGLDRIVARYRELNR
jgi:uncharacterized membrane protein YjdF